jgi:hypothetical protein
MAKDILGREMAPGTPAAAYNTMSVKAVGDAKRIANDVVRPAMQRGFPGVAAVAQGAREDMAGQSLPRQAGTLVRAVPAAAVGVGADVLRSAGLASNAVFGPYMNAASEFGRGLMGSTASTAPAMAATVKPAAPVVPAITQPEPKYTPGAGLPSASQIASERSRAMSSQNTNDAATGIGGGSLNVNVMRQPNGNLSFSGQGGGEGVNYTGMPTWSSQSGGAGKGGIGYSTSGAMGNSGFDLSSQNAKMAAALQGIRDIDRQKKIDEYTSAIASGSGGAVGVAQNKIALAGLGDIVQRQMANDNATGINQTNDATRRAGIAADLTMSNARDATSRYGIDTQAKTAQEGFEVEKQKAAASIAAARAKVAAGKPTTTKDKTALFVFAGLNADGTPRTPAQQAEVERRYASSFGNRDSLSSLMQSYQQPEGE